MSSSRIYKLAPQSLLKSLLRVSGSNESCFTEISKQSWKQVGCHVHRCNKRLQMLFIKKFFKNVLLNEFFSRFYSINIFKNSELVKITQITFPDSSHIGNLLSIKDNSI